mgnify:CR=1 FL=1
MCARRAAQRHTAGRIRTFSSVLSELFLRVSVYSVAREQSRALLFRCARAKPAARRNYQRFFFRAFRTFSSFLCILWLASSHELSSLAVRVRSLLLAEITSAKPVLSMLLTSSPLSNILRISVRTKPAAHRALLFQPLTQTTHSSEGLSFGNPLWQNPKSSP